VLDLKIPGLDILVIDDNSPDGTAQVVRELMEKHPEIQLLQREGKLGLGTAYVAGFKYALERDYQYIFEMYLTGVNVINWPLMRLFISVMASKYTRFITGLPIHDCTSGFPLDEVASNGYSFQIEMNFKAWKRKFKLKEIPIIFYDRTVGSSKMSRKIVYEAAFIVWKLKIMSLLGRY